MISNGIYQHITNDETIVQGITYSNPYIERPPLWLYKMWSFKTGGLIKGRITLSWNIFYQNLYDCLYYSCYCKFLPYFFFKCYIDLSNCVVALWGLGIEVNMPYSIYIVS